MDTDSIIRKNDVIEIVRLALREDVGTGDITSGALFTGSERGMALILAKDSGVFCSGYLPTYIYEEIDPAVEVEYRLKDGALVTPGDETVVISGPVASMLTGERTVLNFLQRMCGIATAARRASLLVEGSGTKILDTRKTAPGMRVIDKYAVKTGGCMNHRMGLHDMVMIKDNHIRAAGGIGEAVKKVRDAYGRKFTVEVETSTLDEVARAIESGADIIMLDNMDLETMRGAVAMIGGSARTEISGNIDEDKLAMIRDLGISFVSMGSLTHSVKAFDLSMKFL